MCLTGPECNVTKEKYVDSNSGIQFIDRQLPTHLSSHPKPSEEHHPFRPVTHQVMCENREFSQLLRRIDAKVHGWCSAHEKIGPSPKKRIDKLNN